MNKLDKVIYQLSTFNLSPDGASLDVMVLDRMRLLYFLDIPRFYNGLSWMACGYYSDFRIVIILLFKFNFSSISKINIIFCNIIDIEPFIIIGH